MEVQPELGESQAGKAGHAKDATIAFQLHCLGLLDLAVPPLGPMPTIAGDHKRLIPVPPNEVPNVTRVDPRSLLL